MPTNTLKLDELNKPVKQVMLINKEHFVFINNMSKKKTVFYQPLLLLFSRRTYTRVGSYFSNQ